MKNVSIETGMVILVEIHPLTFHFSDGWYKLPYNMNHFSTEKSITCNIWTNSIVLNLKRMIIFFFSWKTILSEAQLFIMLIYFSSELFSLQTSSM